MLRFKKDDGTDFPDWEGKSVGDITIELKEYEQLNSGYPLMTSSRIGLMMQEDFRTKSSTEDDTAIFSVVPRGVATYRHMSDDNIFHFNINNLVDKGLVSKEYPVFNTVNGNSLYLLVEYLNSSKKFLNFCKAQKKGGTRTRLYFKVLKEFKFNVPSLPEQQKIADFLSTIDTVIEKQKATVEAWEERKKGVMQKLFSQEVRFKADDGSEFPEWEEKKLGDISERILVGLATTVTPYYREKGRPMFRNLNIKQGYLDDRDMLFLDDDYADSQKNKAIHFGDILTVHTGNIGWSCLVPEKYEGALSFTTLITTVKFNVVSNKYVCDFLNSPLGMNRMQNLAFSGGRANLNTSEFQKVQVPHPCLAEQRKIADCLSSFDEVIEKQKATLAAWEELKKGLLQQMFV
jgi:type I restriction enzyme S subunit